MYLCKQEAICGIAPAPTKRVSTDMFGDIVCPTCKCTIVTPDCYQLLPGTGRCPRCHTTFRVTRLSAEAARKRQSEFVGFRRIK